MSGYDTQDARLRTNKITQQHIDRYNAAHPEWLPLENPTPRMVSWLAVHLVDFMLRPERVVERYASEADYRTRLLSAVLSPEFDKYLSELPACSLAKPCRNCKLSMKHEGKNDLP